MGVAPEDLDRLAVTDPYQAVALDVAALKANPAIPAAYTVTGLVYDIETGKVETVVPPACDRKKRNGVPPAGALTRCRPYRPARATPPSPRLCVDRRSGGRTRDTASAPAWRGRNG